MIYYNSRDSLCKVPFGASLTFTPVKFSVLCDKISECFLITQTESYKMNKTDNGFEITLSFDESGLVFYNFMLITEQGIKIYINRSDNGIGLCSQFKERSYQLTVYENTKKTPKWFKTGIAYQIFPDRFNVSGKLIKAKDNAYYYENWDDNPKYIKKDNEIEKWDFFGGNLKGITEKLPYLKSLDVSVIYLNPIFEANSNHRYNTANYLKIDPILGREEDFDKLVEECDKFGIKIVLDGVFNHTGADSIYFNKFGNYDEVGAYQSKKSKYFNWFKFEKFPENYKSWWGVSDLPEVDKNNDDYISYIITSPESVIKKWTRKKIGGWRLDVADELPDNFLKLLYKKIKECYDDTVVIGEVWEDASNKIAYGKLKEYFTKPELDSVMNYPFRDGIVDFLKGKINAPNLKEVFYEQMENYPYERYMSNFNFLGTHDIERITSVLIDIDSTNYKKLLKIAVMCLFFYPGIPCIYYGDEAGVLGYKDPDNRRTFPKEKNDEIFEIYKSASDLRTTFLALKSGNTKFENFKDDVFGIIRFNDTETKALYVNRSQSEIQFYSNVLNCNITLKEYGTFIS